jgi:ATP-dependent RNA helicase DOB1
MEVVPVAIGCIHAIAHLRIYLPKDLTSVDARNGVKKAVDEVAKRFPDGLALLDPIENMGIKDDSFKKLLRVSPACSYFYYLS